MRRLWKLHKDERGLEGIEYLLIVALVVVACIGAWAYLGNHLSSNVRKVASTIDTSVGESTAGASSTTPPSTSSPPSTPPVSNPPPPQPPPTPPPPPPPPPPLFQGANMTGSMFGTSISSGNFQQNGNVVTGSMIISGPWGSVRQYFSGTANGNTASLQGSRVEVISMLPGWRYNPDNLALTRQANGSWAGTATCTGGGGSSAISLAGP